MGGPCTDDAVGVLVGTFLLLAPLAGRAFAGQQAASIIGQVTDESGAVLPGVTVSATSAALQVASVVDVTNERGEYRSQPAPHRLVHRRLQPWRIPGRQA